MIDWPLGETATTTLDTVEPPLREQLIQAAIDFLYAQTGGMYGLRVLDVRPRWVSNGRLWQPIRQVGVRVQCGHCLTRPCYCQSLRLLRFRFRVEAVEQVTTADGIVDPEAYQLNRSRVLERVDGGSWPRHDLTIHLIAGTPVPAGGQIAAAALAEELAKAVSGADDCALPQRVQTITRQGVTVGMMDGMEDLDDGRTGLWIVDSWVSSVRHKQPVGGVFSPDLPPEGGWGGVG